MAITEPALFPDLGSTAPRAVIMFGVFTIGGSGAVSTNTKNFPDGFTVTKNAAAGRYDIKTVKNWNRLVGKVQMVGPTSAAFPTTTGSDPQCRNLSTTSGTSNLQVQFKRTDTQADADAASGTQCMVILFASD